MDILNGGLYGVASKGICLVKSLQRPYALVKEPFTNCQNWFKVRSESRIKWRPSQPLCRILFINLQYTHGRIPPATSDRGSEEGTRRALSPPRLSDNRGLPPLPYMSVHKRAQPTHQRMQTFSSPMNLINNLHIIMILPLSSFPPQGHKTPRGGATSD